MRPLAGACKCHAPRVVAECWTCGQLIPSPAWVSDDKLKRPRKCKPMLLEADGIDGHRAAGHDVREVKP